MAAAPASEFAGLTTAAAAYLFARRQPLTARQLVAIAALILLALAIAAALETYAVPTR